MGEKFTEVNSHWLGRVVAAFMEGEQLPEPIGGLVNEL
jgi:hypothetical protein